MAASKCCHAVTMPAGGPEPAAAHYDPEIRPDRRIYLRSSRIPATDHPADRDQDTCGISDCDTLRIAHRRDQERTDTWNTSGRYLYHRFRKSDITNTSDFPISFPGCQAIPSECSDM